MNRNTFRVRKQFASIWLLFAVFIGVIFSAFLISPISLADDESPLPVVKMSPQIRIDSRDFRDIPCDQVSTLDAHTQNEQRALSQRKQQCLAQYQQFIPNKALK